MAKKVQADKVAVIEEVSTCFYPKCVAAKHCLGHYGYDDVVLAPIKPPFGRG